MVTGEENAGRCDPMRGTVYKIKFNLDEVETEVRRQQTTPESGAGTLTLANVFGD